MSASRSVPGVMILHDSVLHHYYLDEARFGAGSIEPYVDALSRWYGPSAGSAARAHLGGTPFVGYPPDDFTARYPLLEEATLGALGLVVHSNAQAERVAPHWAGPIARLDLPCRGAELAITEPSSPPASDDGRLRLVSFGLVGGPKQIHLVLDALGRRPDLRDRVKYVVAGPYDPRSEYFLALQRLVESLALAQTVEFLGYVSNAELERLTAWADAFVNLRWPSTEGGSASLTRQLLSGRPVVISRSGVFDEVPEDAAVKLTSQDADGVARAIDQLLAGADARHRIGVNGRRFARRFSADAYARGILQIAEEARRWRPVTGMIDHVGDLLAEIGAADGMSVFDTVGAEVSQMFGVEFAQGRTAGEDHGDGEDPDR